jgi:hypothetical protein
MGDQDSECCAETIRLMRSTITGNATGWVIHNADVGFMSAVVNRHLFSRLRDVRSYPDSDLNAAQH